MTDSDTHETDTHETEAELRLSRVQALSGMRPGEVTAMRGADLDRSGDVWIYSPREHKGDYLGHARPIFLGPRAQEGQRRASL